MKEKNHKNHSGSTGGEGYLVIFYLNRKPDSRHPFEKPLMSPNIFQRHFIVRMSLENSESGRVNRATMTNYGAEMLRKSDIWRWQAAPEKKVRIWRKKQLQRRRYAQVCAASALAILTICLPVEDWTDPGERGGIFGGSAWFRGLPDKVWRV